MVHVPHPTNQPDSVHLIDERRPGANLRGDIDGARIRSAVRLNIDSAQIQAGVRLNFDSAQIRARVCLNVDGTRIRARVCLNVDGTRIRARIRGAGVECQRSAARAAVPTRTAVCAGSTHAAAAAAEHTATAAQAAVGLSGFQGRAVAPAEEHEGGYRRAENPKGRFACHGDPRLLDSLVDGCEPQRQINSIKMDCQPLHFERMSKAMGERVAV